MNTKSEQDVLDDFIEIYGKKDGEIVARLTFRVSNLFFEWRAFLYLFCGPTERVDTLNAASGKTSKLLQKLLWDSVLLSIRKFLDPAGDGSNTNLSLQHLQRIAKESQFGVDLTQAYEELKSVCEPARKYATKYLAHSDLKHAIGSKVTSVQRGQTTDAVRAIGKFANKFHAETRDTDIRFSPIPMRDDEKKFLLVLHRGVEETRAADLRRRAYLKQGNCIDESAPPPSWIYDPTGDFEDH